jgi:crossover junction endodeoxyribonuclease RuvC
MNELRILGIDPGTIRLGYGLLGGPPSRPRHLGSGILSAPATRTAVERLGILHSQIHALLTEARPTAIAIESSFHGKNTKALIRLGEARGMVIGAAGSLGIPVTDYSPAMVKKAVTGRGNASKEAVARMVSALLPGLVPGADLDKRLDHFDALAVALCHVHRHRLQRLAVR